MLLRRRPGGHPILFALGGGLLLLVLVALAAAWYALGEERRTGRLLSRFLSRQVGIPIVVERVVAESSRLTLRGISIPPGGHWGGAIEIRELRVEGGVLPVIFPRGRALTVVAVSTSVTIATETTPFIPPAPDTFTAIRSAALRLFEWPAVVSLEMKGGELHSGSSTLAFDLKGEKTRDGKLVLHLDLRGVAGPPGLTVEALGEAAGGNVVLMVRAEGDPRRLGQFWPSALPALGQLTAEADLTISALPELGVTGGLTATPVGGESPAPINTRFAFRYHPRAQRVDLSRFDLQWGPALRLELTGSGEELEKAPRLAARMTGTVDESRLTGELTYGRTSGVLTAKLDLQPFVAGRLMERLGYPRPTFEVRARSGGLRLHGQLERSDGQRVEGSVDLVDVEASPWRTQVPLRANLRFAGTLSRRDGKVSPAWLDRGELSLASPRGVVARLTAQSQSRSREVGGLWPLSVEAQIPDLTRLPSVGTLPFTLSGDARVSGTLNWMSTGSVFSGHLAARVPKGEVNLGGPVVISDLGASLPLAWGGREEAPPGAVTAESLSAFGFVLHRLRSPGRIQGSVLSLSQITYAHYGGSGRGWAESEFAGASVPLRMRLEGEGVDLATLVTEYGLTVGRITGKVGYRLTAQYSQAQGFVAAGHVASDPPGGQVNIDALKKLLAYAEADPTGILKRTLETLSVFSYQSLAGDIRVGPQGGRLSLSLQGKKRLGLFPGPVQAINFQNIPISLLVKTFGQPRRDSP